ncbi:MAG TPA: hypothetical protein PLB41_16665 [Rubrivivax sp.]|nr:hypothetical protein [Rubrivivax sp.]
MSLAGSAYKPRIGHSSSSSTLTETKHRSDSAATAAGRRFGGLRIVGVIDEQARQHVRVQRPHGLPRRERANRALRGWFRGRCRFERPMVRRLLMAAAARAPGRPFEWIQNSV